MIGIRLEFALISLFQTYRRKSNETEAKENQMSSRKK